MARKRNLYDPKSKSFYRLSRTKLENFLRCARCFYLDRRLGVSQPPGFPFNLNSAVDELLKREFDDYRTKQEPHPFMQKAGIDAVPAQHSQLETWRQNFKGVSVDHEATGFTFFGAIDDLWLGNDGKYLVCDYKATAKNGEVSLDADWQISYKRQMEIYQWLLRRNGLEVSDRGWFVYCNGRRDLADFNERIEFKVRLLPYDGDDDWVEGALKDAATTLHKDELPEPGGDCQFCRYRREAAERE
jgi:hypothetical protein